MNNKRVRILLGIIFVNFVLILSAGQASASFANATASLDWTRFAFLGDVNWISSSTTTSAAVSNSLGQNDGSSYSQSGWVPLSSTASVSYTTAQSQMGNVMWLPSAASQANPVIYGLSSGTGSVVLTGSFTANTSGWVIIQIPYTVSLALTAADNPAAYASGASKAFISLSQDNGSVSTDTMEIISTVYGGNSFEGNRLSWLGIMKLFNAGETGIFRAEVMTETSALNPVPLPGALWLFGPGLACFVALRRKFHQ